MIRLGVIGNGGRVSGVINCLRQECPELRVTGIVDPDEAGARARLDERDRADVKFYPDLKRLVRSGQVDALAIGTRCDLHTPYACQAAAYDLPLFLEKPVSNSMRQAVALEKAFRKSRCQVVVSFPLRVSPLCALARRTLEDGAVGRPEHILAINYVPYGTCYFDMFYRNFAVTQGLFLQKATHDFDYMAYLMGSPIVHIAAMALKGRVFGGRKKAGLFCSKCAETATCLESPANRKRNGSGGLLDDHPCVFGRDIGDPQSGMNEDASSALIQFANGAQGVYTQVFFTRRDAGARGATVSGYHGTLSFDWYKNEMRRVRHHAPFSDTSHAGQGMSHFGGDAELAREFIALIKGQPLKRITIWDGLRSVYACLAAKESSETGKLVAVRQV
ncbi:MAG: Gfo/Idh/MocA family oxidoreductase [Kiritimatiellae bacterium]|nr:Gfo/Idh/MocA family oxidoreductase [Kiritimatiellia bacterium]